MRMPVMLFLLGLVALSQASLLEMSQVLWSRVLDGGYERVGRLDPLRVPVIKVDQSEGETSYRVILRDLEVSGLNDSKLESVRLARGRLQSNLSDSEAGYVSYNEQRDMDAIRYRFHTLIKEPKFKPNRGSFNQFERIVQYDPTLTRVQEEEDLLGFGPGDSQQQQQQQQQQFEESQYQESRNQQEQQHVKEVDTSQYQEARSQQKKQPQQPQPQVQKQEQQPRKTFQASYQDMKVAVNTTPRNPAQVRVVYTHNFKGEQNVKAQPQQGQERPCVGACKRNQTPAPRVETRRPPAYELNAKSQAKVTQGQQFDRLISTEAPTTTSSGYSFNANIAGSSFSAQSSNGQRNSQFSINSGSNTEIKYSGNNQNRQFSAEKQSSQGYEANTQRSNQFSIKADGQQGVNFAGNYKNGQISVESNSGENIGANGQAQNRFSFKTGGSPSNTQQQQPANEAQNPAASNFEIKAQQAGDNSGANNMGGTQFGINYAGSFKNSEISINSGNQEYPPTAKASPSPIPEYFKGPTNSPTTIKGGYRNICEDEIEQFHARLQEQAAQRRAYAESTTPIYYEEFPPYKAPIIRMEKQPGYVDIIYASESKQASGSQARFENFKASPATADPRAINREEISKDGSENDRYVIHNSTASESRSIEAARAADESRRIQDLSRYAKEYQEKQGYYEEGMELIYHFGQLSNSSRSSNDSLTRRKRQHVANDKEDEENVMHVIARLRVPKLSVKANYALSGKVGRQLLRGNGRLAGNFTNVIADFTVELKRVDNKTLVVRAARAKLIAGDHSINLQGMDVHGPVEAILNQGLLAAEAVAAMVIDDLTSKILSESSNESMVYKMYRNLPVIEKE